MKENIEEDIKYIEEQIEYLKEIFALTKHTILEVKISEDDIDIISGILSDYKRVLKENEELKKELGRVTYGRNQLFEYATAQQANPEMLHKVLRVEYIPKQKIKDKIEKYKKLSNEFYEKFLETNKTDINIHDAGIFCDAKVQVLQDLLEKKEE